MFGKPKRTTAVKMAVKMQPLSRVVSYSLVIRNATGNSLSALDVDVSLPLGSLLTENIYCLYVLLLQTCNATTNM